MDDVRPPTPATEGIDDREPNVDLRIGRRAPGTMVLSLRIVGQSRAAAVFPGQAAWSSFPSRATVAGSDAFRCKRRSKRCRGHTSTSAAKPVPTGA